jgi:hypothetical protein
MSHARPGADTLLIRPTHDDRTGAGGEDGQVPLRAPSRADQFSGHALATGHQRRSPAQATGGPTLTVRFHPVPTHRASGSTSSSGRTRSPTPTPPSAGTGDSATTSPRTGGVHHDDERRSVTAGEADSLVASGSVPLALTGRLHSSLRRAAPVSNKRSAACWNVWPSALPSSTSAAFWN